MKKEYINPTLVVVEMKTEQCLMAGSVLGVGSGSKNPSEADSREFDPYWDEEDW
ncbi:MAG: hypothetical protein IJ527_00055 [Prevotella sp.]|nr:hypothetical protein [Prevotella sp.]